MCGFFEGFSLWIGIPCFERRIGGEGGEEKP